MKKPPDKFLDEKPPERNLPYYKTIKTSLASVLKLRCKYQNITDAVCTVDQIVSRSLMFLKMYLIDKKSVVVVDDNLIDTIFKIVCKQQTMGRPTGAKNKKLKEELKAFYDRHFKPLLPANSPELTYAYLSTVLDYAATQIVTVFQTNIKQHYVEYVESYVNAIWQRDFLIERIRKIKKTKRERDDSIRKLTQTLRSIKDDLLAVDGLAMKSHRSYHDWIKKHKEIALPRKSTFEKDLIYYDLQVYPQDYWLPMLAMTSTIEIYEKKIRNFCPLRTSYIPKHITLDTTSLVHLLYSKDMGKKSKFLTKGELKRNQDWIWHTFFRTDMRFFEDKNYVFNHMIDTDGVSVSILMIRRDLAGKKAPKKRQLFDREKYVDDLSSDERDRLSKRKVVGIDPNMSDLLYCANGDASEKFRYTQNQRRQETRDKRYKQILLNEKNHSYVEERSIIKWETDLTDYNHRTVDLGKFKAYVKAKLSVGSKIRKFYTDRIFRKLKLSTYWNIKRSESWMLERFSRVFGDSDQVVIGIGDWEQKKHRKFKEPTKGKGFRNLLRQGGYPVYLVDEFRTSCQCSSCQDDGAKCEKFRVRLDPNTKKSPENRHLRLVHGLLACKMCNKLWNRDVNSAINIARLTREILDGKDRPDYLSRSPSGTDSAVASTVQK